MTGRSVTAIVPTHNRTLLLAMTLRTILWQEDVDLEVIVVDDGSSEDVRSVIEQLGDSRLRLIRHEVPQGVAHRAEPRRCRGHRNMVGLLRR